MINIISKDFIKYRITALKINNEIHSFYVTNKKNIYSVGDIFWGKVVNYIPGLDAAFVDIGFPDLAYLQLTEKKKNTIKNNDFIVCQIVKEAMHLKQIKLSDVICFKTKHFVYKSSVSNILVSKKIINETRKQELISLCNSIGLHKSLIIRTESEFKTNDELLLELQYINQILTDIRNAKASYKIKQIYKELPLELKLVNQFISNNEVNGNSITIINDDSKYVELLREEIPNYLNNHVLIQDYNMILDDNLSRKEEVSTDIWDTYNISYYFKRALQTRIDLTTGDFLIFDETEALTTIDVNSSGNVGYKNRNKQALNSNIAATKEIASQIKQRNLSGIIIIDYINMDNVHDQKTIINKLKNLLEDDFVQHTIFDFSELGLVQIARQRTCGSLLFMNSSECTKCNGVGRTLNVELIVFEIKSSILKLRQKIYTNKFKVVVSTTFWNDYNQMISTKMLPSLELLLNLEILLEIDNSFRYEYFSVVAC